ncbi:hypothetical protein [Kitasatospora sp. NPDC005856]|uniref:hypothetical protein n=1 Tax=Kitasatospora sp. NPDC005856 TaxID=3154566 RepID=UPI0033ECC722
MEFFMQTNPSAGSRAALVGGSTVRIGELAGPGRPSEDRVVTTDRAVIVLDGVSTVTDDSPRPRRSWRTRSSHSGRARPYRSAASWRAGAAGRKQVSWSQVQGVHTMQGLVRVEAAGKPTYLTGDPVWMFPNLQLFTALVERLRR